MADESLDVDAFDMDEVEGTGGYVDDDIDLDDDDDDEPLVSSTPRTPSLASPRLQKAKRRAGVSSPAHSSKRRKLAAHPDDFLLRASGTGEMRDYVVSKFVTRMPEFTDQSRVRLFRNTETTAKGRAKGIEADRKQKIYYNTFSGKQRLERYKRQGIVTIPDRYRKGWTMEITEGDHKPEASPQVTPSEPNNPPEGAGPPDPNKVSTDPNVDVFAGTFDGKTTSRYAILVLGQNSKTIDVVPIDEYAWFSFRTRRAQGSDSMDPMEARKAKMAKRNQRRMSKFQGKYEEAQSLQEQAMGDNTRIQKSKEFASVGIRRNRAQIKTQDEGGGEGLDFDLEFDNDDVAQVDKDMEEKPDTSLLQRNAEQDAKDFQKMIKDEPVTSRPASPGSESDEDPAQKRSPQTASRSPSPSRPASASRSPKLSERASQPGSSRQPTPMGGTPAGSTSFRVSPSPRSPRGNTPQKLDLSHLLPPPGTLPTQQHVLAVLTVLLKNKKSIELKEMLQYFQRKTKPERDNLTKILKNVSFIVSDPARPKLYHISLKEELRPAGLPTGR